MEKMRIVWDRKAKMAMAHLCLNVIDNYNSNMNGTDITNQLQGVHRPNLQSLDEELEVVVELFYLGNWGSECECV
jgi:hypothetical protein